MFDNVWSLVGAASYIVAAFLLGLGWAIGSVVGSKLIGIVVK